MIYELCRQIGHSLRAEDRDEVPECEGIEPEIPGPIIFIEMTIELNITNPSRDRLVMFSSMVISTKMNGRGPGFDAR